ncbi:Techylectin-5B,Ficolin-2,Fibroleukin,Fibrinogen-like protein 1,Ficolin-1,Angiopoietin-4 [Mytilus edulis]|uniref:Techylectin-5B,Ficolin-2,Fibroleukin,Fibrinogen-l ike protein 1,Ficolin-1,Angiopoietin-4 n=1 Tax=Mytilus edulis TaxID=6550 RepID=A0A8S3RYP1_MYTED|nr:Techylectin-5B,Ficolin-2,Fibroleukin,Fibrinogen-like protein 1,Ficolin-1,Angiopoietin-4 [Mytilus edulis]
MEVKLAVSKEMKDVVESVLDKRMKTAQAIFGKSYNLTLSNSKQKIDNGTAQIEETIAAVYNKTEAFGRKLTEVQENTVKKNTLMMSKQNKFARDINSLTTMDNKLKEHIEKMTEKQKLTESKLLLVEIEIERFSEKAKGIQMKDCNDANRTIHKSGVYHIYPSGAPGYKVYCDMDTDDGGWTVFQYRSGGLVSFHTKLWKDYKNGFGEVRNDRVHQLTGLGNNVLRIYLEDWEGNSRYAVFNKFFLGDEVSNYILSYGSYSGNAGNSLANNVKFTTADRQNDGRPKGVNCAKGYYGGPWWYDYNCGYSDLNGEYVNGGKGLKSGNGLVWNHWKGFSYSMKVTKMMIRKK